MAHTSETIQIDGVKVKIATGLRPDGSANSQTVNVYDHHNSEGSYRTVYRITGQENFITLADLRGVTSIANLDAVLRRRNGVTEERPR